MEMLEGEGSSGGGGGSGRGDGCDDGRQAGG